MPDIKNEIQKKFANCLNSIRFKKLFYCNILLILIIFGILSTTVAGNEQPYSPWFITSDEPSYQKTSDDKYIQFKHINWTAEENKFSTDLQILLYSEKNPLATPRVINSTLHTLKTANKFVSSGEPVLDHRTYGNTSLSTSDIVYVSISTKPGISTHILDPYLHLPIIRSENIFGLYPKSGGNVVDAWVNLSELKKIANLSEVINIQTLITGFLSSGSVNTEGDEVLHSALVRNLQNGPNGSGIRIGVISDGVEHKQESLVLGDIPSSLLVIGGDRQGDEGTAMLKIIHDIAPNPSLIF